MNRDADIEDSDRYWHTENSHLEVTSL